MKRFMDEDFLLHSEFAEDLYHEYAEKLPILDYHTHIPVRDIAENRVYHNLTEVLVDNPVARRLMRANGVAERFITGGEAPARERFQYFAEALAKAAGNPVYTWVHLVLKRIFDCHYVLSGETADDVWAVCSEKFADGTMTVRSLLEQGNVAAVFTADHPEDNLKWHRQLKEGGYPVQVLPVFHPDAALDIANPEWGNYMLYDLGQTAGVEISTMNEVREALAKRIAYKCVGAGMVVMSVMGVVLYFAAPVLMGIMTDVPEVIELGTRVLRIEAWAEPMFAAAIVSYSAFIGTGDTLVPAVMNLSSMWVVRLTLAWFLAPVYGLVGVWSAMCAELIVRGGIFLMRLKSGVWLRKLKQNN